LPAGSRSCRFHSTAPNGSPGINKPAQKLKTETETANRFDRISPLADVPTELLTDPNEGAVDVAGSLTHASCGRQCNKRDDQHVLDQSLATLVIVKSLQRSKHSRQFVTPLIQRLNASMVSNGWFVFLRGSAGQGSRMSSNRVQLVMFSFLG